MAQNDPNARDDELRGELVTLDEFLLARTELTAAQWTRLGGEALGDVDPRAPAVAISWLEADTRLDDAGLRLPTEAQWEYACRARTTTPWWTGDDVAGVGSHGWFGGRPQPVALLQPNGFGLYDLHGNVAEWCRDELLAYGAATPRTGDGLRQRAEPVEPSPTTARVVRGGAANDDVLASRSSARAALPASARDSAVGLRPVRPVRR